VLLRIGDSSSLPTINASGDKSDDTTSSHKGLGLSWEFGDGWRDEEEEGG
jgi:hypothetical protein